MQNRGRDIKQAQIIINRPESISKKRRYGERTVTTISWGFWILLLRPVLIIALWFFGVRLAFMEIFEHQSSPILETYLVYLAVVFAIYISLQFWNRYNVMRFRGKERRRRVNNATDPEVASFLGISTEDLQEIKKWKKVNINFLHDNRLVFENEGIDGANPVETTTALKLNSK